MQGLQLDNRDHFLVAADARFREREHLHLPAFLLGEARVHAEDFGGNPPGLVAARAGADFEDDVLFVVGVLGQEQHFQLLFERHCARLSAAISRCAIRRRSASLSASIWRASARPSAHLLQLAVLLHGSLDLAQRLPYLLVFFVVVQHLRQRELRLHLVVTLLHLFQSIDDHVGSLLRL